MRRLPGISPPLETPRNSGTNESRATAAAHAMALQRGFSLGDWLVEPLQLRASCGSIAVEVTETQMQVLVCLAEGAGTFVHRRALRSRAGLTGPDGDRQLRQAIAAWHAILGDSARRPRYLAANGRDGYSIVARLGPGTRTPIPERLMSNGLRGTDDVGGHRSILRASNRLLAELRRRRVFQVSASYLVGMWVLLQVVEVTFAPLHFPTWWASALTILAVIGWPIMLVVAWTYQITSDGVVRDSVDVATSARRPGSRRLVAPAIIAGVVAMAVATGYAWWESIR